MADIRTLIVSAVASEGNVGQSVWFAGAVHDKPDFPYIVLEDEGAGDDEFQTNDGVLNAERFEFSVHIHTMTRNQGLQLHDLISDALHGYSGTTGNTVFGNMLRQGGSHFYNEKLKSNEQIIDFETLITNN